MATALDALLRRAIAVANWVGVVALAVMTMITMVDVLGRYLFNRPLLGALELSEVLMVCLVFGAFAVTELRNGHVEVDVVVNRFSSRTRALCEGFAAVLSTAFWGAISWRTALHAANVATAGETTTNLGLPTAPFVSAAAIGCGLFTLTLLLRALGALRRLARS